MSGTCVAIDLNNKITVTNFNIRVTQIKPEYVCYAVEIRSVLGSTTNGIKADINIPAKSAVIDMMQGLKGLYAMTYNDLVQDIAEEIDNMTRLITKYDTLNNGEIIF